MALLTTQSITPNGIVPVLSEATAGGDTWQPSSTTFLAVKNGDAAAHTVTVVTTAISYGQPVADVAVTVQPGTQVFLGPFDAGMVANSGTGLGSITYDSVTSVTVGALST
jgi:hypothetical protein